MTRDEALETKKFWNIPIGEVVKHINKIYDDFESRTCENCKFFTECDDGFNYCDAKSHLNGFIDKKFGCNLWELKDGN